MGRPKTVIDPEQVEKLAMLQCTLREIGAFFGCDEKTLRNRFSAEIAKGKEQGKISLRRMQWKTAEKGGYAMQIWLGKQYLGQKDTQFQDEQIDDKLTAIMSSLGAEMV